MALSYYSGTAIRAAHFAVRPGVPGLNPDHTKPDPEPDPFNPVPDTPANQAGTQWNPDETPQAVQTYQPNLAQVPVSHWYDGQPPVENGTGAAFTPSWQRNIAFQQRMLTDHDDTNYVPDGIRLYQHYSEGQTNLWTVGRMPQAAGQSIPDGPLAGLQNGRNAYDATNGETEVYSGDDANVGRYRLGRKSTIWGEYQYPIGKFGQDAMLHAYTGLYPALPYDKPAMSDTAPYTPNSTGTAHWFPAQSNQVPSNFSLPSETALTDFSQVNSGFDPGFTDETGGEFH